MRLCYRRNSEPFTLPRSTTSCSRRLLQHGLQQLTHVRRVTRDLDPALFHDGELFVRRTFAAGNNRARVAHAFARRRGNARDEADHGLLHVRLDPACAVLFVRTADFADHDDRFGIRIVVEHFHDVDVLQPVDRVAADADARRLAEPLLAQLADRFIGERARPRYHADRPFFVDMAEHDADLDLVRRDYARAVGADQFRALALHFVLGAYHVAHRYALGLSLIHISEPTRLLSISYAVFCLKKKKI